VVRAAVSVAIGIVHRARQGDPRLSSALKWLVVDLSTSSYMEALYKYCGSRSGSKRKNSALHLHAVSLPGATLHQVCSHFTDHFCNEDNYGPGYDVALVVDNEVLHVDVTECDGSGAAARTSRA